MKHLLPLLFILSVLNTNAQNFEWGNSFDSRAEIEKIIGESSDKVFSHSTRTNKNYIDIYDKKLNFKKSKLIEIEGEVIEMFMIDGEINILNYIYDKKKKEVRLYSNTASENGSVKKDNKLIMIIPMERNRLKGEFNFVFSPDKTKILFHHKMLMNEKTSYQIMMKIVDNKFDEITSDKQKFIIDKKQREETNFQFAVSNSGNYYMLVGRDFHKGGPYIGQKHTIFCYDKTGNEVSKKDIKYNNKHLANSKLNFLEGGSKLVVSGFFMNIPEKRKGKSYSLKWLNGIWNYAINENDNSKVFSVSNEFEDKFYREFLSENRYDRKKSKEDGLNIPSMPMPVIKEVISHSNGFYVVSEQFSNSLNSNPAMRAYALNYGQILAFNFSNKGDLYWSKNIFKNQIYTETMGTMGAYGGFYMNDGIATRTAKEKTKFYSFLATTKGNDLKILYLDSYKNIGVKDSDDIVKLTSYKRGVPFLITINPEGELNKKALSNDRDEVFIAPKVFFENDKREFIIYGEKKKEKKLSYFSF